MNNLFSQILDNLSFVLMCIAVVAGIALLVSRLKQPHYLPQGRDDIIDAL